ncbi:hypothetical protein [Thermomonospora echinospora]|uniref:hypothetical protein n=1 Tax=Thermomonospora echinospora TaxID=1992 RepID=UPI0011B07DEE|nr:hypothetical protein [Thermomonospora echinospora]
MLRTVTSTVRPGQSTRPTATRSGWDGALGEAVTVGAAGGLVGVGVLVGEGDLVGVRVGDAERLGLPLGLSVVSAVGPLPGDGVSDALELDDESRSSIGTTSISPMTKNTAAMMTLGNCIALSRPRKVRARWC